jgi:hypothetical protein
MGPAPRAPGSLEIRARGEAALSIGGPLAGRPSLIRLGLRSRVPSERLEIIECL